MKPPVVIVGGSGVFGGRLARRLIRQGDVSVVIAGRDLARAQAFCKVHGGEPLQLDRDGDVIGILRAQAPFAIVDAAGPFQGYGSDPYRLARAAIALGSHYLDLSDDADFTAGIVALDASARTAGVVVRSGVSSVPAISAAAVRELADGLKQIELIDTVILPGNRAPRGVSVVRAIVSQAGRPLPLIRGGVRTDVPGWSGLQRIDLAIAGLQPLGPRWASFIGAPDLQLFASRFGARSVLFRAGLELSLMHLGLWALSWLARARLISELTPLSAALHRAAGWLEGFGSDRGGMRVAVTGVDGVGHRLRREWTLIAEAGEGPEIPAIPAFVLIGQLLRGALAQGARPCLDEPTLVDIEAALSRPAMSTARTEAAAPVLYERVLGDDFRRLPPALQALHSVTDQQTYIGEASIENGRHPLARVCRWLFGFPPAGAAIPVRVTMEVQGAGECWTRDFAGRRFRSFLQPPRDGAAGIVTERFGPAKFRLHLPVADGAIAMPVLSVRLLGLPLPAWLSPRSDTREWVDDEGRARFDVAVSLPFAGLMIRYRGWLRPLLELPAAR